VNHLTDRITSFLIIDVKGYLWRHLKKKRKNASDIIKRSHPNA